MQVRVDDNIFYWTRYQALRCKRPQWLSVTPKTTQAPPSGTRPKHRTHFMASVQQCDVDVKARDTRYQIHAINSRVNNWPTDDVSAIGATHLVVYCNNIRTHCLRAVLGSNSLQVTRYFLSLRDTVTSQKCDEVT